MWVYIPSRSGLRIGYDIQAAPAIRPATLQPRKAVNVNQPAKPPRKVRSDKGKPRGAYRPRKAKVAKT